MKNPYRTIDELLNAWTEGIVARGSFFAFLAPMFTPENIDELMSQVPAELKQRVEKSAHSLAHAHGSNEDLLDFGGPSIGKESWAALRQWSERNLST